MEECVLGPLSFSETLQRTVECSVSSKSPLLFDASFCWPVDTADIATSLASRCDARSDRGAFEGPLFLGLRKSSSTGHPGDHALVVDKHPYSVLAEIRGYHAVLRKKENTAVLRLTRQHRFRFLPGPSDELWPG